MADAIQISQALMIEAKSDIRSAKLLLDGTEYSRSIYHSQLGISRDDGKLKKRELIFSTEAQLWV